MEYTLHILRIKLWEWKGVAERWNMEINKNGPDPSTVDFYNIAMERVSELKKAISYIAGATATTPDDFINKLKSFNPHRKYVGMYTSLDQSDLENLWDKCADKAGELLTGKKKEEQK